VSHPVKSIVETESRMLPTIPCLALLAIFSVSILYSLLKGGRGLDSIAGIEACSGEYWGLIFGYICVSLGITCIVGLLLTRDTKAR
jgi:hypothetical protein